MGSYERAFIYMDTNALECRHSGKSLFLSQLTINPLYYSIEKTVKDLNLSDKVQICIPEIVWLELKEHLVLHFKTEQSSMYSRIEAYRKSFGDLMELSCSFKEYKTEVDYKTYLDSITDDFLNNPRVTAKIIPCPMDVATITEIIGQAVHSSKPFRTAKINGKEYTDAGFKDALIFQTIVKNTGDQLGIFVSNDNDFSEVFFESSLTNLHLCNTLNQIQELLSKEFNVATTEMVDSILRSDDYLMRRILTEAGFDEDVSYKFQDINSCDSIDEGIDINFIMTVNGDSYVFNILYNRVANELLEVSYEMFEKED